MALWRLQTWSTVGAGKSTFSVLVSHTVLEVLNQQGDVLGFWAYRSGLGVVSMVPIDSPPSEGPGTTLVPWKTGRMVAGTMESMGTNGWQLGPPPLVPPN